MARARTKPEPGPATEAANVALQAAVRHRGQVEELRFVLFGDDAFAAWMQASSHLLGTAKLGY